MFMFWKKKKKDPKETTKYEPIIQTSEQNANIELPYQRIEREIEQNPKSALYRVPIQQTSANFNFVTLDSFMKKAKTGFVVLDLETTGLDTVEDAIVEIGAVRVRKGEIVNRYNQLIDPERLMPENATQINKITDSMLIGKPHIYQVIPDILDFFGDDVVVAHNAKFDAAFITQVLMRYRFKMFRRYFDSMELVKYWPEVKNRKLSSFLCAAGIENTEAHRALSDAESLAQLVIKTLEKAG